MKKNNKTVFILLLLLLFSMLFPMNLSSATPKKPKKISLNKKSLSMKVKQKYILKLKGINKKKVKWSSNKKYIATVKKGKVVAKKRGKTTIIAKVFGKKYRCKVNVSENKNEKESKYNDIIVNPDFSSGKPFSMFFTVKQVIGNKLYLSSETNPKASGYILKMTDRITVTRTLNGMSFGAIGVNGLPTVLSDAGDLSINTGTRLKIINPNVRSSSEEKEKMEIVSCTIVNIIGEGCWFYSPLYVKQVLNETLYLSCTPESDVLYTLNLGLNEILVTKNGEQCTLKDIIIGNKLIFFINSPVTMGIPGGILDCTKICILEE